MRNVLRFAFVVVVVALVWNWSASFQRPEAARPTERLITMRVQASARSAPVSVTVTESYAVQVQWSEEDILHRFALRPNLIDGGRGSVRVAIESPEDGRVLDEVVLTGPRASTTQTLPSFEVQVVQIDER